MKMLWRKYCLASSTANKFFQKKNKNVCHSFCLHLKCAIDEKDLKNPTSKKTWEKKEKEAELFFQKKPCMLKFKTNTYTTRFEKRVRKKTLKLIEHMREHFCLFYQNSTFPHSKSYVCQFEKQDLKILYLYCLVLIFRLKKWIGKKEENECERFYQSPKDDLLKKGINMVDDFEDFFEDKVSFLLHDILVNSHKEHVEIAYLRDMFYDIKLMLETVIISLQNFQEIKFFIEKDKNISFTFLKYYAINI